MLTRMLWFARKAKGRSASASVEAPSLNVLMVCTGNICRSPTAEGVLRKKLERAGLDRRILVDSAGTHGFHQSEPPDPRAVRHAAKRGYDLSGLRARSVRTVDFSRFHWMLAMDESNLAWLMRHVREGGGPRIELLARQAPDLGVEEVPDPYYGPDAGFENVLDLVERACDGFLARLVQEFSIRA
jgi:protein-tyrosine phosphatase